MNDYIKLLNLRFFCDETGCPYEKIENPEKAALVETISTTIVVKTMMSDKGKLIKLDDKRLLYENLENVLWHIFFDIHAIYEPDGDGPYGECYMAAVDLFNPGMTFRIYFNQQYGEKPTIEEVERWRFG